MLDQGKEQSKKENQLVIYPETSRQKTIQILCCITKL